MAKKPKLTNPLMVAVWPGMGNVAVSAGYYLMAKLGMHQLAEYEAGELFDVDHVLVKEGIIQPGRRPQSRFFVWTDPKEQHDLIVFLSEAQPPVGKYNFCRKIIEYAEQLGVERIFTFAAMATQMHPEHASRVFGAATDEESLEELQRLELQILQDGHIGGLNGVLLGVAAEQNLRGVCLLGEMPHIFNQLPFPKASLAVLEVFTSMVDVELDFTELTEQAQIMEQHLGELLSRVEQQFGRQFQPEEEGFSPEPQEEPSLSPEDHQKVEQLFEQAARNRSKAYELKRELDRLGVFKEYEDRFLDLFKSD